MKFIDRLMKRGTRKRAGGAYEKRLSLEIKAAKTVAIVTGCFIFCWLGFSILYGFSIDAHPTCWAILFWLGYLNSALNPVIYTVFNREFRHCFRRFLTCDHFVFAQKDQTRPHQTASNSAVNLRINPAKPGPQVPCSPPNSSPLLPNTESLTNGATKIK